MSLLKVATADVPSEQPKQGRRQNAIVGRPVLDMAAISPAGLAEYFAVRCLQSQSWL